MYKSMRIAAFMAVIVSLFALVVPMSAFADNPPEIPQEDCTRYKAGYDAMIKDPQCAGLLPDTDPNKPKNTPPVPSYKLLCQEGTTGQEGIHWENGDATHVGGLHCTCAPSPDPVVRG